MPTITVTAQSDGTYSLMNGATVLVAELSLTDVTKLTSNCSTAIAPAESAASQAFLARCRVTSVQG
jgi:hypothetical protein